MNENLLEPLKFYNSYLKNNHLQNIDTFFDNLIKKSNIDVEENRKTVKAYKDKLEEISGFENELKKYNVFKTISIILIAVSSISFIMACVGIMKEKMDVGSGILLLFASIVILGLNIFLLVSKINPTIKNVVEIKSNLENEADKIQNKCFEQMAPLNRLYDSDDARQLIMKTIPDIVIDKNFEMERFEYLNGKYGLTDSDDVNTSSLKILTGDIVGNPYVIIKNLSHKLGTCRYTGSLTIHWETYSYDSKGNRVTHHHSQVLTASLEKPKPYYSEYTTMLYGNEAAPNLKFTRYGQHIEKLSDKEIARLVKKGSKKIQNKAKEAVKNGSGFTPLGNDEFDSLFGALDRNNEAQFRLLFTPLAQSNMLDLMKNGPFGDDFSFCKENKINRITGENSYNWDLNTSGKRFSNYDIDDARDKFIKFHVQYFDHFYFQIAPVLAIPLYQQYKPSEYIYKHKYVRNYTSYQTEVMANILGDKNFAHAKSKTKAIIKTSFDKKDGGTDDVNVIAYSYDAVDRLTYISVYGGDGYYHDVPVKWVEYIPLSRKSSMRIKEINITDDKFKEMSYKNEFAEYMSKHYAKSYGFENGMFAMKVDDSKEINNIDSDMEILLKKMISNKGGQNG